MDKGIPLVEYKYVNAIKRLYEIKNNNMINDLIFTIANNIIKRNRLDKNVFSDIYHYYMYKIYFKGYPIQVMISPDYLVVSNIIFVYAPREYCYGEKCIEKTRAYIDKWVFGINSDSKIFINHLDRDYGVYIPNHIKSYDRYSNVVVVEPVVMYRENYEIRMSELSYDRDYGNYEKIFIDRNYVYRIQGEILYSFHEQQISDLVNSMVESIVNSMFNQIYGVYNTYIYVNVEQVLRKLGFSVIEHNRLDNIDIRIVIPRVSTVYNENARKKLNYLLYDFIVNELNYDVSVYVNLRRDRFSRYYSFEITISHKKPFAEFEITKYVSNALKEYVRQLIENRVYREYTVYHGNHIIKIQSLPLEYSVSIPNELNPLKQIFPENDIILNANIRNNRRFYVLKAFKSIIQHNQHGITNIEFLENGIIDIENTRVSNIYPEFQNRVAFRLLVNDYNNKENNNNNRKITEYINGEE